MSGWNKVKIQKYLFVCFAIYSVLDISCSHLILTVGLLTSQAKSFSFAFWSWCAPLVLQRWSPQFASWWQNWPYPWADWLQVRSTLLVSMKCFRHHCKAAKSDNDCQLSLCSLKMMPNILRALIQSVKE